MSRRSAWIKRKYIYDRNLLAAISDIAEYLLGNPAKKIKPMPMEHMHSVISGELGTLAQWIYLSQVSTEDGIVSIPYKRNGKVTLITAALKNTPQAALLKGREWKDVSKHYKFTVRSISPERKSFKANIIRDKRAVEKYNESIFLKKLGDTRRKKMHMDTEKRLSLDDFREFSGEKRISAIKEMAAELKRKGIKKVAFISSAESGGGVAEMMPDIVSLFKDAGIDVKWLIMDAYKKFYDVTGHIHEGAQSFYKNSLSLSEISIFDEVTIGNFERMEKDGYFDDLDFLFVEDPQPMGLIPLIKALYPHIEIAWRCHIDTTTPNRQIAQFVSDMVGGRLNEYRDKVLYNYLKERLGLDDMEFREFMKNQHMGADMAYISGRKLRSDMAIYHMEEFALGIRLEEKGVPAYLMPPAINPFNYKNMPLPNGFIETTMKKYGLSDKKFTVVEISRFDPYKGPLEAIHAFSKWYLSQPPDVRNDIQFVYANNIATDNPKGLRDLKKVKAYISYIEKRHPELADVIHLLLLHCKTGSVWLTDEQKETLKETMDATEVETLIDGVKINALEVNALQQQLEIALPNGSLDYSLPRKEAIQPSSKEGFGLVFAEAAGKGTPISASLVGGLKVQLEDILKEAPWLGIEYSQSDIEKSLKLYEKMDQLQLNDVEINDEFFERERVYDDLDGRMFVKSLSSSMAKNYNVATHDPDEYRHLGLLMRKHILSKFTTLENVQNRLGIISKIQYSKSSQLIPKGDFRRQRQTWMIKRGDRPDDADVEDEPPYSIELGLHHNSRRSEFIFEANYLVHGTAYHHYPYIENIDHRYFERDASTEGIMRRVEALTSALEKIESGKLPDDMVSGVRYLKAKNDQFEADSIIAGIILLARKAAREKSRLIIPIETDWIPGYADKRSLSHEAAEKLMAAIRDIPKMLRAKGIRNVKIIHKRSGESLEEWLDEVKGNLKRPDDMSHVVILGSVDTINYINESGLRNVKREKRPFMAAVDAEKLKSFYDEYDISLMSDQIYIQIMDMLSLALEIAAGKTAPNISIIKHYDAINRIVMFLPEPVKIDYDALLDIYKLKRKLLQAAA
ncbi:MAG: hypothetical protein JW994_06895 [Candidatus Omnitrophica bacterium]|nr:hypothetical protein [Candidatus Omnitrophota bacterium]